MLGLAVIFWSLYMMLSKKVHFHLGGEIALHVGIFDYYFYSSYNTTVRIGIDVSQVAYEGTGVSQFIVNLVEHLVRIDKNNQYILFFSSLRKQFLISNFKFLNKSLPRRQAGQIQNSNFKIKTFKFPPSLLDLLWNRLHILPIEWLIGDVDVFITSDWTEPPTRIAKKATILYDLIVYKYPNETDKKIVETQKRKLRWVKKESKIIFCISEATKRDAMEILGIPENRLRILV